MRIGVALLLLLISGLACSKQEAASAEKQGSYVIADFPQIRPVCDLPDSLTSSFQDGPDFYTYRTVSSSELPSTAIGIYFGHIPSHHLAEFTDLRSGIVAGETVTWRFSEYSQDSQSTLFMETILVYPPHNLGPKVRNALQIHVWASAETEAKMNELADILKELEFVELSGRDEHKN